VAAARWLGTLQHAPASWTAKAILESREQTFMQQNKLKYAARYAADSKQT